jgi:two-component system phosphate regulon sensor histidine kinase PhoR
VTRSIGSVLGSFRLRLVLGYALVAVLLAGIWAWSLYGPLTQWATDQQRTGLTEVAKVGALTLSQGSGTPAQRATSLARSTGLRITIVASDGTVLADSASDASAMQNHASRPEVAAALHGRVGYAVRRSATLGTQYAYVAAPAALQGVKTVLRVSEPLAEIEGIASQARGAGLALLLVALILAAGVGWWLSLAAARPLARLQTAAETMAAGDLSSPLPSAPGELGELAQSLTTLRDTMRATIGELEAGQATLRAVLDGLQDAVFLIEAEDVVLANRAAGALFHEPASGWRGTPLAAAGLPTSLEIAVRDRLGCETACSGEVGPDPEARYFRVTEVPLGPGAEGPRTLVVISDVTSVRRLDQVRRDFVANASHELKTPASAIQLLADAADTAASDDDMPQALVFVGQMKDEAERLRRLVLDLLDLSRLDSVPTPGTITDVRAAATNALAAHRAAASDAGLTLALDLSAVAESDVYAAAEPTDVAVALDNLLANAIAYTAHGGVTVRLAADEHDVTVSVTDTGIGIPAEHLPRVFERFYRVDAARTRVSGGTGLGLSLVRNAAERAGGTVSIDSSVGQGTTVTLRLPRTV